MTVTMTRTTTCSTFAFSLLARVQPPPPPPDENTGESVDDYHDNASIINGLCLDQETYLQAEDTILRPDGSLDFNCDQRQRWPWGKAGQRSQSRGMNNAYQTAVVGLFSPPPSYLYYRDDGCGDNDSNVEQNNGLNDSVEFSDEEKFYQAVMDTQNGRCANADHLLDPELLHQQVFAEEQAYLQQSEGGFS